MCTADEDPNAMLLIGNNHAKTMLLFKYMYTTKYR